MAALEDGLRKYGLHWAKIEKEHGVHGTGRLASRNQVALKDKARSMKESLMARGLRGDSLGVWMYATEHYRKKSKVEGPLAEEILQSSNQSGLSRHANTSFLPVDSLSIHGQMMNMNQMLAQLAEHGYDNNVYRSPFSEGYRSTYANPDDFL